MQKQKGAIAERERLTSRETERTAVKNSNESYARGDKRGRNLPNWTEDIKEQRTEEIKE